MGNGQWASDNERQQLSRGERPSAACIANCPWTRFLPALLPAALLLLLTGCAGQGPYDPDVDAWPLVRTWSDPAQNAAGLEALGPIIEWERGPKGSHFNLRPLYSRGYDPLTKIRESDTLWPFGFGTSRPDLNRTFVFPFYLKDRETFPDGASQTTVIVLPLWYSKSARGEDPASWLLFPLAGSLYHFQKRDRVVIVLWPLYIYQASAEAKHWSFIYPLFGYVRWNDGGRGYKFWPLYGMNRRPEPHNMINSFVLWPIWQYQYKRIEQGEIRRWWVFPLVGHIEEPRGYEWAFLWPFFGHRVDRNLDQSTWWYPWPILGHRTGGNVHGRSFLPVYSYEQRGQTRSAQFLWPLGWYRAEDHPLENSRGIRLIPLAFREKETRPDAPATGAWQFWPLVKWRNEKEFNQLETLSLFPMRNYVPWERHFAPLFRVFEYRRDKEQQIRSWRLLWRLVRVDSGPNLRYAEVTPLFDFHRSTGEKPAARWSMLKGLVGYERTPDRRRLQLLYFVRIGLGRTSQETPAQ